MSREPGVAIRIHTDCLSRGKGIPTGRREEESRVVENTTRCVVDLSERID